MSTKKIAKRNSVLDQEEKELLSSFEKGEWQSVKNLKQEKAFAEKAAANYKKKRTNPI